MTTPAHKLGLPAIRERLAKGQFFWRDFEDAGKMDAAQPSPEFLQPFSPADEINRRDFLKFAGASLALAGLAGCTRQPAEPIVPYVKQPEEVIPGKPLFYASAREHDGFASGLLVESHEGHPTKIEGNPDHPENRGATSIYDQAAILDLYDPDRAQSVLAAGNISTWGAFLSALNEVLQIEQSARGAGLRILTGTVTSPTLAAQLEAILQKFPYRRLWRQHIGYGGNIYKSQKVIS